MSARTSGVLPTPVAPLELGDTPLRVHGPCLAGVERVALGGDLHVHYRIGLAVVPLDGLVAGRGGPGQEGVACRAVAEDDLVVVGVLVLLHTVLLGWSAAGQPD